MKNTKRYKITYRSYLSGDLQTHTVIAINGVVVAPLGLRPGWVGSHIEHIEARMAYLFQDVSITPVADDEP
jgi:hypothetical protein